MRRPSLSSPLVASLVVFGLAVGIRAGYNVAFDAQYRPFGDSIDYVGIGWRLADANAYEVFVPGDGFRPTARRPPLLPLLVAACAGLVGRSLLALRLLLSVIGATTCVLLSVLAGRLFGRSTAFATGVAAAVLPTLWIHETAIMTESLAVFLVVAIVLAADVVYVEASRGGLLLVGVLCGLLELTRPDGVLAWCAVASWIVVTGRTGRRIRWFFVWALAVMLVLSPWVVRNVVRFKAFVPGSTATGALLAGANNWTTYYAEPHLGGWTLDPFLSQRYRELAQDPNVDEVTLERYLRREGLAFARQHVQRLPAVVASRLTRAFELKHPRMFSPLGVAATMGFCALLVLGVAGAVAPGRRARRLFLLYAIPLFYAAGIALTWGNPRFRAPMEPMLLLFTVSLVARRGQEAPAA